jgi:Fe-Mn family superoxide dismutase
VSRTDADREINGNSYKSCGRTYTKFSLTRVADRAGRADEFGTRVALNRSMETFEPAPLPYDTHALEPHIGRETVEIHYEKHHAGYATKLRELTLGKPETTASLEGIIGTADGAILDNAAQIWNHDFYWRSMHPDGGGVPSGDLNEAIVGEFGDFEKMRSDLLEAGTHHFGSGWLWLVSGGGRLRITTTHDADLPLRHGDTAILCADLWEHAYYLDYRNERARYLETFIDHLANWEFAEANWRHAPLSTLETRPPRRPDRAAGIFGRRWPSLTASTPRSGRTTP